MYKRRASIHRYTSHGMDVAEFEEAERSVVDLITDYQDTPGRVKRSLNPRCLVSAHVVCQC